MPTPAGNPGTGRPPVHRGAQSSRACTAEVNVIEGGCRATLADLAAGVTSKTVAILARTALPVGFSRVCDTIVGRGTASGCACQRHAWTTRSRTHTIPDGGRLPVTDRGPPAARCLRANRRTPCCRQPPKQARGSVDNMRVVSTYRSRGLGRVRPGVALGWFRGGPSPFSSMPHKRPHRPDDRRTSLSPYLRHLPGQPPAC
jgi:hypothetical protein